ncbi:MAG: ABC transporter substrate-binding protein [Chloroflexi bacterium]|nr:ABC transporter substrate-binding protein [Chloroflexota bacterium]
MKGVTLPVRHFSTLIVTLCVFVALTALAACSQPTPTPTPAPTATPIPMPTATPTAAPLPTATAIPEPTPTPTPAPQLPATVPGIVDPTNLGWPREVEGLNGIVSIPAKPERIITASVGHDEVILALAPGERLVAVGNPTKSETFSNVASLVQGKPEVTRDPETIIAQSPDVIVTSPFFPAEGIEALSRVGIPVVQTELQHDPEARIDNILLIGYILGEEERALEFAAEVRERYASLIAITGAAQPRPRVLALTQYSDQLWVAGGNSTEGGVITAAGGINAAEEAGIESNQPTSLEGVIAMNPEIIIIPQPIEFGGEDFQQSLLAHEALAEVPAVKNGAVHVVESKLATTLSYWNILGAEELARLLWPDDFPASESAPFSLPDSR